MSIESLGGYRLVRKLGEGARAEVFLGHPDRDGATPAAIKIYRQGIRAESIDAEVEALARATGAHAVGLVDLTTAPDGAPALILERLASGSLGRLLHQRGSIRPGEAVTVLAPLAGALERMHAAGVVHGGIRLESVLFGGTGAPSLACFGSAALIDPRMPPARRETEPGIALDLRSFAALGRAVLGEGELSEWVDSESAARTDWLDAFVERLFDFAAPEPVDFRDGHAERPVLPGRVVRADPVQDTESRPGWLASLALPEWADDLLGSDRLVRLRSALGGVRRRVWVVASAVGVALVAALVLVPTGGESDATPGPSATPTATESPVADVGPVTSDDPVAAVVALLGAREQCIRDLSVLCLDAVDQLGSAALDLDQALIRSLQEGAESPPSLAVVPEAVTLTERLGDSAIVALGPDSKPASVLLMKGEAGWRIRDYLEE